MTLPAALAALAESSPTLAPLLSAAARAAATEVPILVLGEAGSGRSTLARAIHAASGRGEGPLVEVDVGTIPSTLLESELFGHEAGAFTGAAGAQPGRVARASSGTLILDHLEGMPLAAQPKLLRLLAERRFAPLGGTDREADVRFVGVGTHDLPGRVAQGTFREDLYYRLEVMTLELPPLRQRPDDVDPLLDHFLADLGERFGVAGAELTAAARSWMGEYPWPGNLREMRNVLERALVLDPRRTLDPPRPAGTSGRPESLAEVERAQIVRALAWARGHQSKAAAVLGISRKTLWEKRRRYGIP